MKISLLDRGEYVEAFSSGIQWSWAVGKIKLQQLFPFSTCKDFLTDVIWSEKTNQNFSKYDFNWTPKNLINEQFHLIIKNDNDLTPYVKNLQNILNMWTKQLGFKPCRVRSYEKCLFVKISSEWLDKPYMIALLTTICTSYPLNNFKDFNDYMKQSAKYAIRKTYFDTYKSQIQKIWSGTVEDYVKYEDCCNVHSVHYNLGLQNGIRI